MLQAGDKAPQFSLLNAKGERINLKDFITKRVVVYFYPKDNTQGCTIEANDFSSLLKDFHNKNTVVIGISPDNQQSHEKFINKYDLNHILLSDEDKSVANKYGAYGKKMMYGKEIMGIIRSTFIIKEGTIQEAFYNVKVAGHAKKILDLL